MSYARDTCPIELEHGRRISLPDNLLNGEATRQSTSSFVANQLPHEARAPTANWIAMRLCERMCRMYSVEEHLGYRINGI